MARIDFDRQEAAMGGTINADILFQMGLSASTGHEGELNIIEAHKWFNLAALKGKSEAADYRQDLASEMSKQEIAEALKAAREWMQLH